MRDQLDGFTSEQWLAAHAFGVTVVIPLFI
jgi:hypothetical protein